MVGLGIDSGGLGTVSDVGGLGAKIDCGEPGIVTIGPGGGLCMGRIGGM